MNICIDCNRSIGRRATRCKSCANKQRWADVADPRRVKLLTRNLSVRNGQTPYADREWLRIRYEDEGLSLRQIAHDCNAGVRTIARWMAYHAIETRDNLTAMRRLDRHGAVPYIPRHAGSIGSRTMLPAEQEEARALHAQGATGQALSRRYHVSQSTMSRLLRS